MSRVTVPLSLDPLQQSQLRQFVAQMRAELAGRVTSEHLSNMHVIDCEHIYVDPRDWGTRVNNESVFDAVLRYTRRALELIHGIGTADEQMTLKVFDTVVVVIPEVEMVVLGTPWNEPAVDSNERIVVIVRRDRKAPIPRPAARRRQRRKKLRR